MCNKNWYNLTLYCRIKVINSNNVIIYQLFLCYCVNNVKGGKFGSCCLLPPLFGWLSAGTSEKNLQQMYILSLSKTLSWERHHIKPILPRISNSDRLSSLAWHLLRPMSTPKSLHRLMTEWRVWSTLWRDIFFGSSLPTSLSRSCMSTLIRCEILSFFDTFRILSHLFLPWRIPYCFYFWGRIAAIPSGTQNGHIWCFRNISRGWWVLWKEIRQKFPSRSGIPWYLRFMVSFGWQQFQGRACWTWRDWDQRSAGFSVSNSAWNIIKQYNWCRIPKKG